MTDSDAFYASRPLFSMTAKDMGHNVLRHSGAMGVRSAASPNGGTFEGARLRGRIAPGVAAEWQLESLATPGLAFVEGLVTLLGSENDAAILMKYMGRRAARYGESGWRVAATFEAPGDGSYDWLNDVVAAVEVERVGDDLRFTAHELLGRKAAVDAHALKVEPLYRMGASGSVGTRNVVKSPVSTRYISVAEEGCDTRGRLNAHWPAGFSWGAHRASRTDAGEYALPLHIDMRAGLVAENGGFIIQSYIGTTPRSVLDPAPDADRSWITVATFEAPAEGELAYLNEVVALGIGWVEDNEACYEYRIWA